MTRLAAILDQIDSGSVLLPEFQRGYVWNRDQVRGLMRSLYRGYPVGGLLTWETQADGSLVRGEAAATPALRVLILDGQQRITSLYGITRGRPPAFFQGDEKAFSGLRFNVEDETFEFYAPAKMRDDPRWIDVTSLFTHGLEPHIGTLNGAPGDPAADRHVHGAPVPAARRCWSATSTRRRSPARTRPSTWSWTSSTGSTPGARSCPRVTSRWPRSALTGQRPGPRCGPTWTGGKRRDFPSAWTGCCAIRPP